MEINLNNYEAFFLDYYEGRLSNEQTEQLFLFLELHPELKEEFSSFENIILENESIFFDDKNSLIKPEVTHHNYENYLIAEAEGDLTVNEKRALDNFLTEHPEYNKDRILYSKIKIIPDEKVIFNLKDNLKKTEKPVAKVIYLYRSIAVAASVILAIFFFTQINKSDITNPVAEIKTENKQELKEENKKLFKVNDTIEEIKLATEEKPNTTKINNTKSNNTNLTPDINSAVKEETENPQFAVTAPGKIEPVILSEVQELPNAPILEIAEIIQQPEDKTDFNEIPQPTLAQAAINTVEKLISGDRQPNETSAATTVAELAANGLNKLTGKELVSFEKVYNKDGQLKKFQISAGNFGFSRSNSR